MNETLNQKLQRLSRESEKELREIGLGKMLKDNIRYTINYRAKKRLGQCCEKQDINISSWLLEIGDDHDIKNTIIHEILHTFKDTIGHKAKWQYYANYVNNRTDYHITRTTSINKIYEKANKVRPTSNHRESSYKYKIVCEKCGCEWHQYKMTKRVLSSYKHNTRVHRKCGCRNFKIIDIKENKELL